MFVKMKNKLLLLFFGCITASIFSQNVTIPDVIFKLDLIRTPSLDINDDNEISIAEAQAFTGKIKVSRSVNDLTGLEAFVNITELDCTGNRNLTNINVTKNIALKVLNCKGVRNLTNLDVSKNTALIDLNCSSTKITNLDLSKNTALKVLDTGANSSLGDFDISKNLALEELDCGLNSRRRLDVSKHTNLKILDCGFNNLTSLDVSKNIALTELYCDRNDLQRIDISKNIALEKFDCSKNNLSSLDLSKNTALTELDCSSNKGIPDLNLSKNIALTTLSLGFNSFTSLDLSKNTDLTNLNCRNNKLTNLDVSKNIKLIKLECNTNSLTTIDISKHAALKELNCSNMDTFTSLNVTKNTALTKLIVDHSALTSLNVSKNTALKVLDCGTNDLTSLDLSKNTDLSDLDCSFNEIKKIDLSKNIALTTLDCSHNKIKEINISNSSSLTSITCDDNELTILNIANGNNINFQMFNSAFLDFSSNPSLTCITVDNATYSNTNWNTFKDTIASFSSDICYPKLTIIAENGSVNPNLAPTNLDNYTNGDVVALTAVPNKDYQFDGWSGDASGTTNPLTITMDTDKEITALFSKIQVTLTTTALNGTVTVNEMPVNGTYDINTELILTATPDKDYQFDGWSGDASGTTNPLTITTDTNKDITALFSKIQVVLTTTTLNGTITADKAPTNGTYDINTELILTATPDKDYQFDGWSGDASGATNPLTITMDATKDITALFSKIKLKWLGTIDNDWNTSGNWANGNIPAADDNIEIEGGLTNYPTISNDISVNTITLQNNATLIANAAVNASVIYNRTLTDNWHLIASPVVNQTYEQLIADNNFAIGSKDNIGIGTYNNNATSAWSYKKNDDSGSIATGLGLSVKLATAEDIRFTGELNTTTVSFPIVTGTQNNFNLIGNPFTSYINSGSFTAVNTAALSEQTIWLWNGTQYETYTAANTIEIAPTQGFFVNAKNDTNVIFETANQSHQTTNTFARQTVNTNIELLVNENSTKIYFIEKTTKGFDNGYDGSLFGGENYDFAVYTKLVENNKSNKKLAIQALPNSSIREAIIPVGLIAKTGSELDFSVKTFHLNQEISVYLEDTMNNTFTNLSKENYKTTLENDVNGAGRFYLHTSEKSLSTKEDEKTSQKIRIYRSSKNQITITGLQSNGIVTLHSLLGKQVAKMNTTTLGTNIFNVSNLPTGVYIVKLQLGTRVETKKVLLN